MHNHKKKGYVLCVTMILTFAISALTLTVFTIAYRYEATIHERLETLREYVRD